MIQLIKGLRELDFHQLMEVYAEGNRENARELYPHMTPEQGVAQAEQDFYQYLHECFFPTPGAFYAVWTDNGRYVSALRLEPYQDGLLLEALETAPSLRRRGYAVRLISAALESVGQTRVYSHIHRRNLASVRAHEKCGFRKILDYAHYADGTVLTNSDTFCRDA